MIELAHEVILVSDGTYPELGAKCMQDRNIWMVDHCDALIAVWDGTSGGTANCVGYAKRVGKPIVYIDPTNIA
jgi:nucleoside 2-deoxyribosyltransferase